MIQNYYCFASNYHKIRLYRLMIIYIKLRRNNKFIIVLLLSLIQSTPDFMIIGDLGIYKREFVKNAQNTKLRINFITFIIVQNYNKKKSSILTSQLYQKINTITSSLKHVIKHDNKHWVILKEIMFIYQENKKNMLPEQIPYFTFMLPFLILVSSRMPLLINQKIRKVIIF